MSLGHPESISLERPISKPGQLLVEGRSAEIFFREAVESIELQSEIEVRTFGSKEKETFQIYLEILSKKTGFKDIVRALGIIRDAESQLPNQAFNSVCAALNAAGLPAPTEIGRFTVGDPQLGVFILPDCRSSGMLESLCLNIVAAATSDTTAAHLVCVNEFLSCLRKSGTVPTNEAKAKLGAYLISRGVYEAQVGRAAQMKIFPWDSPMFAEVREFLSQLANATRPTVS